MEKKGYLRNMLVFAAVAIMGFCLASCKDDEDAPGTGGGTGNELVGWYADLSIVPKQSDFNEHNIAINNHELLYKSHSSNVSDTYASRSLFFTSDGFFTDNKYNFNDGRNYGRLGSLIHHYGIGFMRIVDESTIQKSLARLGEDNARTENSIYKTPVYKLYAGPIFGNLTYFAEAPTYYTYERKANKLYLSNGDIYTIVDGGLRVDGYGKMWSKYDPSKRY